MEKSKLLLKSFDFDNTHGELMITVNYYPENDEPAVQKFKGSVARYCPSAKSLEVHNNVIGRSVSVYTEDKFSLFQQIFEKAGKYDPNTDTYVVPELSVFTISRQSLRKSLSLRLFRPGILCSTAFIL